MLKTARKKIKEKTGKNIIFATEDMNEPILNAFDG